MDVRAVVFDVGGVLERVDDVETWLGPWRDRLGMDRDAFTAAVEAVDPNDEIGIGGIDEAEFRRRSIAALGLTEAQADGYLVDMWDWYCGELDEELMGFAAGLRPRYRTAILSNSADGARREEERRYAFSAYFDPIVYSHEVGLAKPDSRIYDLTCRRLGLAPGQVVFVDDVPANVDAARVFGMHAVLHRSTPATIRAVEELLGEAG